MNSIQTNKTLQLFIVNLLSRRLSRPLGPVRHLTAATSNAVHKLQTAVEEYRMKK